MASQVGSKESLKDGVQLTQASKKPKRERIPMDLFSVNSSMDEHIIRAKYSPEKPQYPLYIPMSERKTSPIKKRQVIDQFNTHHYNILRQKGQGTQNQPNAIGFNHETTSRDFILVSE